MYENSNMWHQKFTSYKYTQLLQIQYITIDVIDTLIYQ